MPDDDLMGGTAEPPLRWEEREDGRGETSYCRICGEPIYRDEITEHDPRCAWRLEAEAADDAVTLVDAATGEKLSWDLVAKWKREGSTKNSEG